MLKVIKILSLVLFVVLYFGYYTEAQTLPPNNSNRCPNDRFKQKHLEINAVDSAAVASRYAAYVEQLRLNSDTVYTTFNTVFISDRQMEFDWKSYPNDRNRYCIFRFKATKYDCKKRSGTWNCDRKGRVKAVHSVRRGHYENDKDE